MRMSVYVYIKEVITSKGEFVEGIKLWCKSNDDMHGATSSYLKE